MEQVLIATLGLSPGVVTAAYHQLTYQGYDIREVVTVTTHSAATKQCENLVLQGLALGDEPPIYTPERAVAKAQLGSSQLTNHFTDFLRKQLEAQGGEEIFLVLTGGRTSMAAAGMLAVQQFTFAHPEWAEQLHVYHVEVLDETLDEEGSIANLVQLMPDAQRYFLNPPSTAVALVEIPVLVLREDNSDLWARLFEYAAGAYLMEAEGYEQVRYGFNPKYLRNRKGLGEVDVYAEKPQPGSVERVETFNRQLLFDLMRQAFNRNDLEDLCFDLGIDPEDFEARGRAAQMRELIQMVIRHGRREDLLNACMKMRGRYPWRKVANLRQVMLCECKLRVNDDSLENPIDAGVVRRLARKMAKVHEETGHPVVGRLVTNARYAKTDALTLAEEEGILMRQAQLPHNWRKRVDWKINNLRPLPPLPDPET